MMSTVMWWRWSMGMRTPHRRWRSVSRMTTPYPGVVVVIIPGIGWHIHVVVVPIRITGNRCHNRSCHNRCRCYHCRSRGHNHRRRWVWAKQSPNKPSCEATPESRVVMMAERHQSKAQCQCHNSQFLVHCFVLRLEVCCLSLFTLYNIP